MQEKNIEINLIKDKKYLHVQRWSLMKAIWEDLSK